MAGSRPGRVWVSWMSRGWVGAVPLIFNDLGDGFSNNQKENIRRSGQDEVDAVVEVEVEVEVEVGIAFDVEVDVAVDLDR